MTMWQVLGAVGSFGSVAFVGAAIWMFARLSKTGDRLVSATDARGKAEKEVTELKQTVAGLVDANALLAKEHDKVAALAKSRADRIASLEKILADTSTPAAARSRLDDLLSKAGLPVPDAGPESDGEG